MPTTSHPSVSTTSMPIPSVSQTSTLGSEIQQNTEDMEQAMNTYRELTSEDEQTVSLELGRTQLQSIAEAGVSLMNLIQQAADSESQEWRRYSPRASFQPRGRGQRGRPHYGSTARPAIRRSRSRTTGSSKKGQGTSTSSRKYPASRFGPDLDFGSAIRDLTKVRHISGSGSLSYTPSSSQTRSSMKGDRSVSSTPPAPSSHQSRREESTQQVRDSQSPVPGLMPGSAQSRTPSEKEKKKKNTDKDNKSGKKS